MQMPKPTTEDLYRLVTSVVDNIVDEVIRKFAPDRLGGALSVGTPHGAHIFTIGAGSKFGQLPEEKSIKYFTLAGEKRTRLGQYPEHVTSRESMDGDAEQYPGAIRGRDYIFSFSGLSPMRLDEMVNIKLAIALGQYTPGVITRIHNLCRLQR